MLRVIAPSDGSRNSQYGVHDVARVFMKNRNLEIQLLDVQRPFSQHIGRCASQRARVA